MKNPYKTHWYHRQMAYWLDKDPGRDSGDMQEMEVIRLDPEPGTKASSKPPVRIFLGNVCNLESIVENVSRHADFRLVGDAGP